MKQVRFAIFSLMILFLVQAQAELLHPVKWNFSYQVKGTQVELTFSAAIPDGYDLYSMDMPKDGPLPTVFMYDASKDFKLSGKATEPAGKKAFDEIFQMEIKKFAKIAVFRQMIDVYNEKEFTVKGRITYQVCNEGRCVQDETPFSITIKPVPGMKAKSPGADSWKDVPASGDTIKKTDTTKIVSVKHAKVKKVSSMILFFFLAFVGGIFAIFMPCIFPMIPMTIAFFMRDHEKKAVARSRAIFFGLSIIAIYTSIGTVVSFTMGPDFTNWVSTHWAPNLFFFIIFMVFAASFFGMFEITVPGGLITKSHKKGEKGGYGGAFFMAFTLVLISFSCTMPIVGTVLVEAARGEVVKPIIGMLGFSLAFALPFGIFSMFPSLLKSLPKSGGWLNSVKVVFGFIELALGLKFLMIIDQVYGFELMSRDLYVAIWIVIFSLQGLYLLGKLRFAHDTEVKHIGVPRLLFAIITFTFVVYLIPGLFGAPLHALSGYVPPQSSQVFSIYDTQSVSAGDENTTCETPKYADIIKMPLKIKGYFDYQQALACAKKLDKPLFIDFTGHGCVNCMKMEDNVLSDPDILNKLKKEFVVAVLFVDDKTQLPQKDWLHTTNGDVKKTIGAINSALQQNYFNSNAQPYFAVVANDGQQLVAPIGFESDVARFSAFLETASKGYSEKNK